MVSRWSFAAPFVAVLALASGCPEPEPGDDVGDDDVGAETGGSQGETGPLPDTDTETSDSTDTGTGADSGPLPDTDTGTDDDDTDTGTDDDDDDGDDDVGDSDDDGGDPCWDDTWFGDQLPAVIFADTSALLDDSVGSCGVGSAPDFQLGFIAPWKGSFQFDTAGSSFDTVLHINEDECGPAEFACNDNFLALESRLELELDAGELVTVSVDGADSFSFGELKLTIRETPELACDWKMITPNLPKIIQGDTTDAIDELSSGCGGAGAPEQLYRFIAPGPGTYRFDTFGSSFDTVLYAMDMNDCGGAPFACNDDKNLDLQSELILDLAGGQKVLLAVDGRGPGDFGPFLLNIEAL